MPVVAHLYPDQAYLTHKAAAMVHAVAIIHEKDSGALFAAGDLLIAIDDGLPVELLMLLANSLPHAIAAVRRQAPRGGTRRTTGGAAH
ncbi:MAG: hypothetical protein ACYCSH_13765 [Acidithiobacillus sp.]